MSNPADYFMSMMSMENPNEIDSDSGRPKSEAEITKEYNRKIIYIMSNTSYQTSRMITPSLAERLLKFTLKKYQAPFLLGFYSFGFLLKEVGSTT